MAEYDIKYLGETVGHMSINEQGQYKYAPASGVSKDIRDSLLNFIFDFSEPHGWDSPVPYFFQHRIELLDARTPHGEPFGFFTDNYTLVRTDSC